jgi:hypothetical protein
MLFHASRQPQSPIQFPYKAIQGKHENNPIYYEAYCIMQFSYPKPSKGRNYRRLGQKYGFFGVYMLDPGYKGVSPPPPPAIQ